MLRTLLRVSSVALIVTAGVGTAHAADVDIYRWKDAQGIYHYSDQWVPGSEVIKSTRQHLTPVSDSSSSASAPPSSTVSDTPPPEDAPSDATVQAVKDDVAKVRAEQCKQAKENYDKAIHARRIYKSGKDGEREWISDAEADAYRAKARAEMDQVCGNPAK